MDYASIQTFLVGRCGKTIREAALTSYTEFELLAEGKRKEEQEEWERVRWMIYMDWAISPNLKRRPHKPQDVIRFPWEKSQGPDVSSYEPLSEDEIQQISKIFGIERKHISNG